MSDSFLNSVQDDFIKVTQSEFSEIAILNNSNNISILFNEFNMDTDKLDLQSDVTTNTVSFITNNSNEVSVDDTINIRGVDYNIYDIDYFDQYCILAKLTEVID